ncbi:MAG: hypothetical protein GY822_14660 [Deltaproteobacteria bacterium]|nr:hypothetical protein [Deltaproteobacteria bacterium]
MSTLVLDYGFARPIGLARALKEAGVDVQVSSTASDVRVAERLVLPDGFDDERNLAKGLRPQVMEAIDGHLRKKKPVLAVGLGMLLLCSGRTHQKMAPGLGHFQASVNRFDPRMVDENECPLKFPHVGFTYVVGLDRHPDFSALVPEGEKGLWLYFRHRLCAPALIPFSEVAVAHHGVPFAGAVWRDNVLAVQFLPEQSGPLGIEFLKKWRTFSERKVLFEGDKKPLDQELL